MLFLGRLAKVIGKFFSIAALSTCDQNRTYEYGVVCFQAMSFRHDHQIWEYGDLP